MRCGTAPRLVYCHLPKLQGYISPRRQRSWIASFVPNMKCRIEFCCCVPRQTTVVLWSSLMSVWLVLLQSEGCNFFKSPGSGLWVPCGCLCSTLEPSSSYLDDRTGCHLEQTLATARGVRIVISSRFAAVRKIYCVWLLASLCRSLTVKLDNTSHAGQYRLNTICFACYPFMLDRLCPDMRSFDKRAVLIRLSD